MKTSRLIPTFKYIHLAGAGFLCISSTSAKKTVAPDVPNLIIMIADDISMSDFGCYGNPVVKTPNIDSLARNGMMFNNVFLTASSSSPSRASILTGRYPHNTGACELHSALGEEQIFFPEQLKKAGYYTAQAGKWHFGKSGNTPDGPALRAFDRTGGASNDGGGPSGAEKWVTFLKERPKHKPFFMWFAAHDAHRGWDNQLFLQRYTPEEIILPPHVVDNPATRKDYAAYYNEISRFDFYVGEVVRELKNQHLLENTCILIMADNGRPFPRAKTRLIEDGIKSPFIVFFPSKIKESGITCKSLISIIDVAPTLVSIAGAEPSPAFQGKSFEKLLTQPNKKFRKYVFAEHNWHDYEAYERMVCTEKYLLIENLRPELTAEGAIDVMGSPTGQSLKKAYKKGALTKLQQDIFIVPRSPVELYNREKDPGQLNNIALSEIKVCNELRKMLHLWQRETGDTAPDDLTPDWYSRETLKALPEKDERREMPGQLQQARWINKRGPF